MFMIIPILFGLVSMTAAPDAAQTAREAQEAERVASEDLWATEPAPPSPAPLTESPAPAMAAATPSKDRLICRSRPVLGSRTSMQRTCRTAEEWRLNEHDLEQSRRDINDRGAVGCDMRYAKDC